MNIENLPEIESWLYEFSVAVKFIEKKTMGFPSNYENSIILDSILKEDLSNDELQRKVMPFILSYMQILRMVQSSSSMSSNETSPSSILLHHLHLHHHLHLINQNNHFHLHHQ